MRGFYFGLSNFFFLVLIVSCSVKDNKKQDIFKFETNQNVNFEFNEKTFVFPYISCETCFLKSIRLLADKSLFCKDSFSLMCTKEVFEVLESKNVNLGLIKIKIEGNNFFYDKGFTANGPCYYYKMDQKVININTFQELFSELRCN